MQRPSLPHLAPLGVGDSAGVRASGLWLLRGPKRSLVSVWPPCLSAACCAAEMKEVSETDGDCPDVMDAVLIGELPACSPAMIPASKGTRLSLAACL